MLRHLRAIAAAAILAALVAGCGAAVVPQIMNNSERLTVARRLFDKGDYALASDVLKAYLQSGAGNADIDQAVYLLGVSYLRQREWASAQTQFERVLRDYPESDSASASAYRLGEALFGQARGPDFDQEFTIKALAQWEGFLRDWPQHPFVPLARERVATCRQRLAQKLWRTGDVYVKLGLYEPAQRYFRSVIGEYSDTPMYGNALIGLAVADARLGRKDTALVVLRGLEKEFEGRALGLRAAKVRAKVEKWPAEGDKRRRRTRIADPDQAPLPTQPGAPGGITPQP